MEAMKLLQQLNAPTAGVIEAIHARPGDTVDGGVSLVTIKSDDMNEEDQDT
jgi:biotin carboxyl carrier protein